MAESSAVPALRGLAVASVEWLPSGAESGLVRVRGSWTEEAAPEPELPVLAVRAAGAEHRFDSLPDARFARDPTTWRGTYLVPAELVDSDPEAMWLEWPSGARSGLPALTRGVEPPPVPAAPERPEEPVEPGGQVIDRAVLAERRARRAEAAEQAQARVTAEALKAVEVLELRSTELERRLEEATAGARDAEAAGGREALAAALASAAALRARSREWRLRLRTSEVMRAGDAVRLAVLESERATGTAALRSALQERGAELEAVRRQLAAASEAATAARAELQVADSRREELESSLVEVRAQADELRRETEAERTAHEQTRTAAEAVRGDADALRARVESLETALAAAEARLQTTETGLAAAEARLRVETVARSTLEDELDRERARGQTGFEAELERERAAMRAALEAERAASPELERLASEQTAAAAAHEPPGDPTRLVADLDAAAEALRRRNPQPAGDPPPAVTNDDSGPPEDEPPAPDAEPAADWAGREESTREPCVPGVEPVRPPAEDERTIPWALPGFDAADTDEPAEPPAPDAEPGVEWNPPDEPPPATAVAVTAAPSEPAAAPPEPDAPSKPSGPVIVPAKRPPARALVVGSDRRDYPLLRGAIVKLAHDDPAVAGRLLAALLPAQAVAIEGPLSYDVTIREAGTFGVAIAGGRASVERLESPHPRSVAEFHLIGDALTIAEVLAGVNHRIGRFFGPIRARGRKRRLRELRPLTAGTISLRDAARAGARLDPELVYRVLGYAVHPSWTRGATFTIAQEITGDRPEIWYLTARDGAGLTVSDTAPGDPDATVTMDRDVFDRLLRGEPVPSGRRPAVHGDRDAVEQMQTWTQRARGDLA